ncbi:MAG: IS200/IS605 family transposase [Kiritimatiellia bacterium]
MPQSLAQIYLHLIFSTRERESWITPILRHEMHAYMAGISRELDAPAIQVGGVSDHVHVLAHFPRTLTVSKWVELLKTQSNRWFKQQSTENNRNLFAWQKGYGVFSVSPSHLDLVKTYIRNQETHHRTVTFKDEYRKIMDKYNVQYDERYVWD